MILRRALPAFALVLLSAGVAAAASPKEKAEARTLVSAGKKAMKEKRYADGAKALRRADALDPSAQIKIDLAAALAAQGKLVDASRALHAVTDGAVASSGNRRAQEQAKKALAELEPRIPWIQVEVRGPTPGSARTTIDGNDVDASNEVPFDPGDHQISARADDFESAEKTLSLREGAHEHVHLDLKPSEKAPPPKVASGGASGAAIAFLTIGGAGLLVGGGAGIAALMQTSDAKSQCAGNVCPPSAADTIARSKTSGTISTVGFIAGGVGVATGLIVLLATSGGKKEPAPPTVGLHVTPWIGLREAGLVGRF